MLIVFAGLMEREFGGLYRLRLHLEPALSSGVGEVPFTSKVLECGRDGNDAPLDLQGDLM